MFYKFVLLALSFLYVHSLLANKCHPPADTIVFCNALPIDFQPTNKDQLRTLFGRAGSWGDNIHEQVSTQLECNFVGKITRTFTLYASWGQETCKQIITIKPAPEYTIRFPADREIACHQSPQDFDDQMVVETEGMCDKLVKSVKYNLFRGADGCYKYEVTHRVMNWCEYSGYGLPKRVPRDPSCSGNPGSDADGDGYAVNLIVYDDNDAAAVYTKKAVLDEDLKPQNQTPNQNSIPCGNPEGYYQQISSTGYWEYIQYLVVKDKLAPVITSPDSLYACQLDGACKGMVLFKQSFSDNCSAIEKPIYRIDLAPLDGQFVSLDTSFSQIRVAADGKSVEGMLQLPVGKHELSTTIRDECGNYQNKRTKITIADCSRPGMVCISILSVSLSPHIGDADGDGDTDLAAATLWASDYIRKAPNDCSGIQGYAIYKKEEAFIAQLDDPSWKPDTARKSLVVTCSDFPVLAVWVYAIDGSGNYSYCEVLLEYADNRKICQPQPVNVPVSGNFQPYDEQVKPIIKTNPFVGNTELTYSVANDQETSWQIFDLTGKCIHVDRFTSHKGMNQVEIRSNYFPAKGVYIGKLIINNKEETLRLVYLGE